MPYVATSMTQPGGPEGPPASRQSPMQYQTRPCAVRGCHNNAHGFGAYCGAHHSANRKNGHPEQQAIRKSEIDKFIPLVRERMRATPSNPAWDLMKRRWFALVDSSTITVREARQGPHNKYRARAAAEIVKLHQQQVAWDEVMATAAALFIMREQRPAAFKSDKAFIFQLSKAVRKLTDTSTGEAARDRRTGKVRRTYAYMPPRVVEILGSWLAEAFGILGLRIFEIEKQKHELARKDREALSSGLEMLR